MGVDIAALLPPGALILQVVPALDAGGVERTTVDVAAAVVAAGGRALVASAGGRLVEELRARGGELLRLPMDSRDPREIWRNADRLARLMRASRVDLVHARSRAPAWSALWAARRTGAPFVTTYAGIHAGGNPAKRLYNSVMARGDLVIANSAFTAEHLIAEHRTDPARVLTIPRGTDLAAFDPAAVSPARVATTRAAFGLAPGEARPVFLLPARLTRWKGQALLVEALARSGLDAVLVLAGDEGRHPGYRSELQALAARLGVAERVRLPGHLADMPAAYLAADFACVPSLQPEAFGRTAVEPQAMGRPVLVADHGAPRETVRDGESGWAVPPGDAAAWAAALRRAVETPPETRAGMGAAGRLSASRYGLRAMTDATLAAYARLLAERPRR